MKKQEQAVCPGCSRHCTADAIRCKRGRAYFSKLRENAPDAQFSQQTEPHRKHKWERNVAQNGVMWQLFSISRRIKKALHHGEISEAQLLSALNESEKVQLSEILRKLNGCLE